MAMNWWDALLKIMFGGPKAAPPPAPPPRRKAPPTPHPHEQDVGQPQEIHLEPPKEAEPKPTAPTPRPHAGAWPQPSERTPNWAGIVGAPFDAETFDAYCRSLKWAGWRPQFLALHNTYRPTLAQRPTGFTKQHINNLVGWYRDEQIDQATGKQLKGPWKAGPHLFVDDHQIWAFTPLTMEGRHSPSWNSIAIGIEMLGDYEVDDFDSGRGQKVRRNAVAAMATLCEVLDLKPEEIRLHKEDTKTDHKKCPGRNVDKVSVIEEIKALMETRRGAANVA
jgi:N-acetylmuramoyl-L-alanine amidase